MISDPNGRYLLLYCTIEGRKLLLSNVYAPNEDDEFFFTDWFTQVKRFTPEFLILGGDFNLVLDLDVDKQGGKQVTHTKSQAIVQASMKSMDLIDIWRELHPEASQYTWRKLKPTPIFVRLDFFLISDALANLVKKSEIIPGFRTDHSTVILEIELNTAKRGPGYWKMNTSLLKDRDYIDKINKVIEIELNQEYATQKLRWEMVKLSVRNSTLQYSARKKKARDNTLTALQKKLKFTQEKLPNLPQTLLDSTDAQIGLLQRDINALMTQKAKGAAMRRRSRWEFNADRPSKYFLNLEKRNFCKKTIYRLQDDDGNIITEQDTILRCQKRFYEDLYTSAGAIDESYVTNLEVPNISEIQKEKLDSKISLGEIGVAIRAMANNKCPGTDGLPVEFYKIFYAKLKPLLVDLYEEVIEEGEFHLSARRGIISLLEKVGKDFLKLVSWRPLSLLNVDFKVFSKILDTRLKTVLDEIVHPSQTGFIPGRYMAENIMKLLN